MKTLYRSGLLVKNGWPINHFGLTPQGHELQNEIKKKEQEQATIITLGNKDPSKIERLLPQLTPEVLLIDNFEQQLTHFYNNVVEMNLLNQAMALPIGFLFHPDFSLRTFNLNIAGAYKYRIPWEEMYEAEDW